MLSSQAIPTESVFQNISEFLGLSKCQSVWVKCVAKWDTKEEIETRKTKS